MISSDFPQFPSLPGLPTGDTQEVTSEYQKVNTEVREGIKGNELKKLVDSAGGHGGFYTTSVTLQDGTTHNLFLKPFDEAEFTNFEFIQKESQGKEDTSILKYMPRVYGTWESGDGTKYMVMANLRNSGEKTWKQAADLKMTGKGGQSDPAELAATGRDPKKLGVSMVQSLQETAAPNYLTLTASKARRTISASSYRSAFTENLMEKLEGKSPEEKRRAIEGLKNQLTELQMLMKESPMGFIGASIFVFFDTTGDSGFKIYLADPAHCQANPASQPNYPGKKMYWGKHTNFNDNVQQFNERVEENRQSIGAMIKAVRRMTIDSKGQDTIKTTVWQKASVSKSERTFEKSVDKLDLTRVRKAVGSALDRAKALAARLRGD